MNEQKKIKWLVWFCVGLLTSYLLIAIPKSHSFAAKPSPSYVQTNQIASSDLEQAGTKLYREGRFAEAATAFQEAAQTYEAQGNSLRQALNLSNLSLAYQQLGLWSQAEAAIDQSLEILQANNSPNSNQIAAQSLNIQGKLQFSQGKVESALETWKQATEVCTQLGDIVGAINSRINQAQALQTLGFYRRALDLLIEVKEDLNTQSDSLTKVVGLRSLGEALQLSGNLEESRTVLESSLAIARQIDAGDQISATLFSLGNTARSEGKMEDALGFYQQAAATASFPQTKVKAQLNQLRLLVDTDKKQQSITLAEQILPQMEGFPLSRENIYARINLAKSLMDLKSNSPNSPIFNYSPQTLLATAVQQARELKDTRAQTYALGTLGALYKQHRQWQEAQELTQQALALSERINAPDLTYLWQWQLGRLLTIQGDDVSAIAAYETAIDILKSLRNDLVAINSEVQFSFRESVEPVYRELVSLLLKEDNSKTSKEDLEKARKVIESLQLAELDNFFRSACINATPVAIEQVDQAAAVIYPIILPDRLEVILRVPDQSLRHYAINISQAEVEETVKKLRRTITNSRRRLFEPHVQTLYDWLIRPIEADLANSEVKTLVFILDGVLRSIPMAALSDGETYLAEKYAVAVTPGLELLESKSLQRRRINVLAAGLSEARQGFKPLPGVEFELEQIRNQVTTQRFINQEFTESQVQNAIDKVPFPVVHFATHGQFSSKAEDTYILTWDGQINVNDLNSLLRTKQLDSQETIELLVFSACETATGDSRAALGIAGVAVRAGARSTMASLWLVDDEATSQMMARFYEELANPEITKAEALRRAQMAILQEPKYRHHPYFWAPFIMVGNWL